MDERLIHLRIKIKSLADEAKTIRSEANKTTGMVKWGLNHHRTTVVRNYTRKNLLAYGLLIGIPYQVMERRCYEAPDLTAVANLAMRFGGDKEDVALWIEEAQAYLKREKDEATTRSTCRDQSCQEVQQACH